MFFSSQTLVPVLALATSISAQTYSQCNPLTNPGTCPPNAALGKSTSINFQSASDSFTEHGTVQYGSDGAEFTVARSGDNPTISSKWYIMFGHVEFVVKAAPGTGIVSSAVLMSDCLDEIDWEWLGGDNEQVQSNYFRKGQTVTGYNRGAFHSAPGSHDNFHTYSIDWTAEQIVWSIDGNTVRVLEAGDAENGDYPQTPMQIKLGSWAGGDPGNPQGTIEWAGGVTDYSQGPFTMYVKSMAVTDYSTGSSYAYSGTTGNWESIQSDGGQVNPSGNGRPASADSAPPVTSTVPNSGGPLAFDPHDDASVYATRTGWPWDGTATASVVPSGWTVDGNGNLQPPSSGAIASPSLYSPPASFPGFVSTSGPEGGPSATIPTSEVSVAGSNAASSPQPTLPAPSLGTTLTSQSAVPGTSTPSGSQSSPSLQDSSGVGGVSTSGSQSSPSLQDSSGVGGFSTSGPQPSPSLQESSGVGGVSTSGSQPSPSLQESSGVGGVPTTVASSVGSTASSTAADTASQQTGAQTTSPSSHSDSTTTSPAGTLTSETQSGPDMSSASRTSSTMSTSMVTPTTTSSEPSSATTTAQNPTETPPAPANGGLRRSFYPAMSALVLVTVLAVF